MSSDLKPGDRALIVWAIPRCRRFVGRVVRLTGGPMIHGGMRHFSWDDEAEGQWWSGEPHLIRLPPDDEARQMFREDERPREPA